MNTLKTTMLLALLTALLVFIGGLIGGIGGAAIFLVLAGAMNFFAYWFSDKMALKMAGAREVSESEEPHLHNMIREVANLAGMPMPKVYVVETATPNAFATGRNPQHAVVAVTTGIRQILTDRELRAVIGHEMGHVRNRDILTSSIVATIAGGISMIAQFLMFSSLFGGRGRDQNPLISIAIILLAPIAAAMIQMGISRTREYAADQTGAEITHDPEGLASALAKLQRGVQMRPMADTPQNESVAALYIVHPFAGGGMGRLFSTHPPLEDRIARLQKMTYGR